MGRFTILTDDLTSKMYEILKWGLPVSYTCDYFGITRMSFSNWMKRGEEDYNLDDDTVYARFFYNIKKAQAEYVLNAMVDIKSGRNGWQGQAWWLERTRKDFMPRQELQAGEDGKVQVVLGGTKIKEIKHNDTTD